MNAQQRATIAREAARLVEQGWTRYALARNAEGKYVPPESPEAVQWCVVGAIERADMGILYDSEACYEWRVPGVIAGLYWYLCPVEQEDYASEHAAVVRWNNEVVEGPAEVIAALRGYADAEEAA